MKTPDFSKPNTTEQKKVSLTDQTFNELLTSLETREIPSSIDRMEGTYKALQYFLDQVIEYINKIEIALQIPGENIDSDVWKRDIDNLNKKIRDQIDMNWTKFTAGSEDEAKGIEEVQHKIQEAFSEFCESKKLSINAIKNDVQTIIKYFKIIAYTPNQDMEKQNNMRHNYGGAKMILEEMLALKN